MPAPFPSSSQSQHPPRPCSICDSTAPEFDSASSAIDSISPSTSRQTSCGCIAPERTRNPDRLPSAVRSTTLGRESPARPCDGRAVSTSRARYPGDSFPVPGSLWNASRSREGTCRGRQKRPAVLGVLHPIQVGPEVEPCRR